MLIINEILKTIDIMKHNSECVERIKKLFKYQLPSETKDCPSPVFVEIGGGSTHARFFFNERSEADMLCNYLVKMLEARVERQRTELSNLCAEYLREQSK